ncbi:hypothetical protein [Vibrio mytili]|uniref:hypothetical protein n=1 Tax=Vibrio mytili TaxID=50718 RepID=UPI0038B521A4
MPRLNKAQATAITLLSTVFSFMAVADVKLEQLNNSTLIECANVSNHHSAIPEHRAMFRHYLMSERNFSFSQLSSSELEFKSARRDDSEVKQTYQNQCKEVGEYLYSIGY